MVRVIGSGSCKVGAKLLYITCNPT